LLNSPLLNLHRIKVIQFPFAFLCVYWLSIHNI
jgi:hypothetical protein